MIDSAPLSVYNGTRKGGALTDIGTKIKDARAAAQLTQEQVAEALGVSRQTVSNWENGRTYPDILSVIKMSDCYGVSLDQLLKDKKEEPMSDYTAFLEESTNVVRSKNRLAKIILAAVYLGIWALGLFVYWVLMSPSDVMGFALMFFWLLLPVSTLTVSLVIGRNDYWGKGKWLAVLAFGGMHTLAEFGTFKVGIMMAFGRIQAPSWELFLAGAATAAAGMGIGTLIRRRKHK